MSDDQAKRNVEMVSQACLEAAERCRQKAIAIMSEERLTEDERVEGREMLLQLADKMKAQARWWITGEGPCP